MNEHLLRVYTGAAAPAESAATKRAARQSAPEQQNSLVQSGRGTHTICVRPDELKQLLSEEEKEALAAMFTGGVSPRAYGAPPDMVRLSGNLVDRVV